MFERRELAASWFAVCLTAGFLLGACTKSHDVDVSAQPLSAGAGPAAGSGIEPGTAGKGAAGSGAAGRGVAVGGAGRGAAGTGAAGTGTGAAGRIGAAGRTGTAGRTGAAGRAGGAAGASMVLSCGTCASASLFGFITTPACCTSDAKCGLDLTSIGGMGCSEQNAAGTLDPNCPAASVMGVMLEGCCRPDGTCGAMDTYLGLGCTAATSTEKVACTAK